MINNYKNIYFLGIGGIGMSSLDFYFINEKKYSGKVDYKSFKKIKRPRKYCNSS